MTQTARLGLPYIAASQVQKEVTHNEALNRLDVFVTPIVQQISDSPPGSPVAGELYIVGTSPSGDFAGHTSEIAQAVSGGGWLFYTPFKWMDAVVESLGSRMVYDGSGWVSYGLIMKDSGEFLRIQSWEEDVDMSSSLQTSAVIPNRSTVLAVNVRVVSEVTGTGLTTFGVGVSGDASRYGNSIGTAADATNIGLTFHPVSYYADTPLDITPDAGVIESGTLRVNVQYMVFRGPWNW